MTDRSDGACRVAVPADAAAVRRLAEAFYRESGFNTDPDALEVHLQTLLRAPSAHVVVSVGHDGAAVGFAITTTTFGLEGGLVAELQDLYVEPACRRAGRAGLLIAESARWARERGCSAIEVVVAAHSQGSEALEDDALHNFYRARGFLDEGRRLRARSLR